MKLRCGIAFDVAPTETLTACMPSAASDPAQTSFTDNPMAPAAKAPADSTHDPIVAGNEGGSSSNIVLSKTTDWIS